MDAAMDGLAQTMGMKVLEWTGLPFERVIQGELKTGSAALDEIVSSSRAKLAAAAAKLPAQAAAMAAYFHHIQPQVPYAREFWDALTALMPWHLGAELARAPVAEPLETGGDVTRAPVDSENQPKGTEGVTSAAGTDETPAGSEETVSVPGTDETEAAPIISGDDTIDVAASPAEATENAASSDKSDANESGKQVTRQAAPALVLDKLFRIWGQTGRRPVDVLRDVQNNAEVHRDLLSDEEDIPRAYQLNSENGVTDASREAGMQNGGVQDLARTSEISDFDGNLMRDREEGIDQANTPTREESDIDGVKTVTPDSGAKEEDGTPSTSDVGKEGFGTVGAEPPSLLSRGRDKKSDTTPSGSRRTSRFSIEPFLLDHSLHKPRAFAKFAKQYPPTNEGLHTAARDIVVRSSENFEKKHGKPRESLVAVDENRNIVTHYKTDNLPDSVMPTKNLLNLLAAEENSFVLHHNHPDPVPMSSDDMSFLAYPGLRFMWPMALMEKFQRPHLLPKCGTRWNGYPLTRKCPHSIISLRHLWKI